MKEEKEEVGKCYSAEEDGALWFVFFLAVVLLATRFI